MSTWSFQHSLVSPAPADQVWAVLSDVEAWSAWDPDVVRSRLDGPLAQGVAGTLRPASGPTVRFTVTRLEPGRRLSDVTRLPLARLEFDHVVEPAGSGTRLTHTVTITGPATPLFASVIGRKVRAGLPGAMAALAELAGSARA